MLDRIFAAVLLATALAYGFIAFTIIEAPFQYDPLGPESWPRMLAVAAVLCLGVLLWRPEVGGFDMVRATWLKLAAALVLLFGYAELYEPFGFVIATFLFSALAARLLGCGWGRAGMFAVAAGIAGYLVCAGLLDLNLPPGPFPRI